jgi:hypothetical protein
MGVSRRRRFDVHGIRQEFDKGNSEGKKRVDVVTSYLARTR